MTRATTTGRVLLLAAVALAAAAGDWHVGLAWMVVPAVLAPSLAALCLPRDTITRQGRASAMVLLRRPRVWLLMACFGLVNGGYSTVVAWLAPFYREWMERRSQRELLAIMAACQALAALLLPMLAKGEDRRSWLWLTLAMQAAGFAALASRPRWRRSPRQCCSARDWEAVSRYR
jgi:CP family cyanate transporter-like MFS transporter